MWYNSCTDQWGGLNDIVNERGSTMRRGYGRGYGLFDLLFDGVNAAARYIADERREARGEAQQNTEYLGDISGSGGLEFAELLRADMEREKEMRESTERQQREKYNFSDRSAAMDDLFIGSGGSKDKGGGNNNGGFGNGEY